MHKSAELGRTLDVSPQGEGGDGTLGETSGVWLN